MRKYLTAIGIWLLVPLVVVSLPFDAPSLTCLAMLYFILGGLLLTLVLSMLFFLTRKKPQAAAAVFLVVAIWSSGRSNGFALGARIHLFVNENRYAEKIKQITRATSVEQKARICGDECIVDSKLTLVTFHYCHCPLFWPDIVYDPGGALEADRSELKKINFYLHDSRHLTSFWYIGYFGD